MHKHAFGKHFTSTLLILSLFALAYALAIDIYLPGIPYIRTLFRANQKTVQLTLSVFVLTAAIAQLFLGPISEFVGRKSIIILSGALFTWGSLFCALANNIQIFLLARFLQAIGACGLSVCTVSIIRDLYSGENITKSYSFLNAAASLSPLFAPILGSLLLSRFSWRILFVLLFIYGAFITLMACAGIHETKPHSQQPFSIKEFRKAFISTLKSPQLQYYICFSSVGNATLFTLTSMSPYLFIDKLHITVSSFGLYFSVISLINVCSNFMTAKLAPRIGSFYLVFMGTCLLLIGSLTLTIWGLLQPFNLTQYYLSMLILTPAIAMLVNAGSGGALQAFHKNAGFANAIINSINLLSAFTATSLIMLFPISNISFGVSLFLMAVFLVSVIVLK